jgi:hypothetical protein
MFVLFNLVNRVFSGYRYSAGCGSGRKYKISNKLKSTAHQTYPERDYNDTNASLNKVPDRGPYFLMWSFEGMYGLTRLPGNRVFVNQYRPGYPSGQSYP